MTVCPLQPCILRLHVNDSIILVQNAHRVVFRPYISVFGCKGNNSASIKIRFRPVTGVKIAIHPGKHGNIAIH